MWEGASALTNRQRQRNLVFKVKAGKLSLQLGGCLGLGIGKTGSTWCRTGVVAGWKMTIFPLMSSKGLNICKRDLMQTGGAAAWPPARKCALRNKLTLIKMLLKFPHTTVLSPSLTPVIYAVGIKYYINFHLEIKCFAYNSQTQESWWMHLFRQT